MKNQYSVLFNIRKLFSDHKETIVYQVKVDLEYHGRSTIEDFAYMLPLAIGITEIYDGMAFAVSFLVERNNLKFCIFVTISDEHTGTCKPALSVDFLFALTPYKPPCCRRSKTDTVSTR